jgi:capsular exopolysaccharide synthesis family protein
MGFFYQAIKKATGQSEDQPEIEPLQAESVAVAAPPIPSGLPPAVVKDDAAVAVKAAPRPTVQHFEVQHPIGNMVAFLTPPVLQQNIVAMEQCRVIRSRLRDTLRSKKMKTVMLTSATASEGKTLLAVNLAFALSQIENTRVLLVDADLRRPSVAAFLKMPAKRGLSSYLTSQNALSEVTWRLTPSLDVVPTQELVHNAAELLHGSRMQQFLAQATNEYNIVLLDGPPLLPIVDAQVLSGMVDAAVMVVRAESTPYDLAGQAAQLIKHKLIGSILNCVERLPHSGYYSQYGYGYNGTHSKTK